MYISGKDESWQGNNKWEQSEEGSSAGKSLPFSSSPTINLPFMATIGSKDGD